jgi:hypothetical protein
MDDPINTTTGQKYAPGQNPRSIAHRFQRGNRAACGRRREVAPEEPLDVQIDLKRDMEWCYANMMAKRPTRPPSTGAVAMMEFARRNAVQFLKQYIKLYGKPDKPDDEPEEKSETADWFTTFLEEQHQKHQRGEEGTSQRHAYDVGPVAAVAPPPPVVPVQPPAPPPAPPPPPKAKFLCRGCQQYGEVRNCGGCFDLARYTAEVAGLVPPTMERFFADRAVGRA